MTTSPLTDQQLDELETLAKNIPAGPWSVDDARAELRGSHGNLLADLWDDRLGAYFAAMHEATLPLVAEVRRLRAEQPTPIDQAALAGLMAFHAGKLAATFRLYLSNELPENRAGMERAVGLLDLHKEQLLGERWTDDVRRMLTAMVGALTDEGAASMRRDGFGVDEVAEILSQPTAPAAEQPAACRKCGTPFDPADTRHDGHAREGITSFCRRCVDRCHESSDAFHQCVICQ